MVTATSDDCSDRIMEDEEDDELSAIHLVESKIPTSSSCQLIEQEPTTVIAVKSFREPSPQLELTKEGGKIEQQTSDEMNEPKYDIAEVISNHGGEEEVISDYNDDQISSFNDEQVVYILNDGSKSEINPKCEEPMQTEVISNQYDQVVEIVPDEKPAVVRIPRVAAATKQDFQLGSTMGEHVCFKCNKIYSTRTNLQRHLNSHDGKYSVRKTSN